MVVGCSSGESSLFESMSYVINSIEVLENR